MRKSSLLATLLNGILLSFVSSVLYAQTAPSTYTAYTGTDTKAIPPAPALGPANSAINDPTFGSRILRVTDQNTNSGESFISTDAGFHRAWNANSTAIKLTGPHGDGYWLEFDPSTFSVGNGSATPAIHSLPFAATWEWSAIDPDIIYFLRGNQIATYNKSTGVITNLGGPPNGDPVTYLAVVVGQDNWVCAAAGTGAQNSYTEIYCVNPITPSVNKFIDVVGKTINGVVSTDSNWPTSASGQTIGIHDIAGGSGASWLEVTFHQQSWGANGGAVLDLATDTWSKVTNGDIYWSGHVSMGNAKYVNSSGSVDGRDSRGLLVRNPDNLMNSGDYHFVGQPPNTSNGWCDADHSSWFNSTNNPNAPILLSRYTIVLPCQFAWSGEIIAAAVDDSNTVWRFAHNHNGGNVCYYAEAFAQISNDGRWALFSSYWDGALGPDTSFGCSTRIDTFVVDLLSAGTPSNDVSTLLSISSRSLANATQGSPYSATLTAVDGVPPYSWSVVSGTLPVGLTLSGSGVISGTPTGSGSSTFTVQVTDAKGQKVTAALTLTVDTQALAITTTSVPNGVQNTAYSATLAGAGGTVPYSWSLASGNLPSGLLLGSTSGIISGTPTGSGTTTFGVRMDDAKAQQATVTLNLMVSAATSNTIALVQSAQIEGTSVASLSVGFPSSNSAGNLIIAFVRMSTTSQTVSVTDSLGNAYSDAVAQYQTNDGHQVHLFYAKNTRGGANSVTATFSSGNNHPWLSVYEYSGLDSTNPLDLTAQAQSSGSTPSVTSASVSASSNELVFAATGLPVSYTGTATAGSGYLLGQQDTGSSRAANETGTLSSKQAASAGFTLSSPANWTMVLATFKAAGASITTVPSPAIATTTLPNGIVNAAYNVPLSATGGTAPYSWSVVSGSLPPGLSLAPGTGVISGTPTASGASTFTIQVSDANLQKASATLNVLIKAAPAPGPVPAPAPGPVPAPAPGPVPAPAPGPVPAPAPGPVPAPAPGPVPAPAPGPVPAPAPGPVPAPAPGPVPAPAPGPVPAPAPGPVPAPAPGPVPAPAPGPVPAPAPGPVPAPAPGPVPAPAPGPVPAPAPGPIPVTTTPIQLIQKNAVEGSGLALVSAGFATANRAGNLIIAFVRMSTTNQTVTIRDTMGNVYSDAVNQVSQTAGGHQAHIFYARNIAGGSNKVTASFSAANDHSWLAIYEYSGLSTTNPLDQTAHAQANSAVANSGMTPTTYGANELVFAGTGLPATYNGSVTAGTGYTMLQQDTGTSRAATEAAIVKARGSFAAIFGLNWNLYWTAVVATFK